LRRRGCDVKSPHTESNAALTALDF